MGGLAHYLEQEGLITTHISLVREHTEKIRPPRALWVPFPLGRPFGGPGIPEFQMTVLRQVLGLVERLEGPILENCELETPEMPVPETPVKSQGEGQGDDNATTCAVFIPPEEGDTEEERLKAEISMLEPLYEVAKTRKGRTTVGLTGFEPEGLAEFLCTVKAQGSATPLSDLTVGQTLKLVVEDIKAFYMEAVSAHPALRQLTAPQKEDWLWAETELGKVFWGLEPVCRSSTDPTMLSLAQYILVPRAQSGDAGENPEYRK